MTQLNQTFLNDTLAIADHVKQMALSGDMSAAKLYFDFALNLSQKQLESEQKVLELTDKQALQIIKMASKDGNNASG